MLTFYLLLFQTIFGKKYFSLGSDFKQGSQLICEANKDEFVDSAIKDIEGIESDINITKQRLLSQKKSEIKRYILTLDVPITLPDLNISDKNKDLNDTIQSKELSEFGSNPQSQNSQNETSQEDIIKTNELSGVTLNRIQSILLKHNVTLLSFNSVDSKVSSECFMSSLSVFLLSIFFIIIYFFILQHPIDRNFMQNKKILYMPRISPLWVSAGIVLATIHDVCFMLLGCYFLEIDIELTVLAAILTIIGYSTNDSVVLWAHIQGRANKLKDQGLSPVEIVSSSIDGIFSRSVLTAICTLIPSITILILDISPVRNFAIVMLIGTVAGALSTIYIVGEGALRTLSDIKNEPPDETEISPEYEPKLTSEEIRKRMYDNR